MHTGSSHFIPFPREEGRDRMASVAEMIWAFITFDKKGGKNERKPLLSLLPSFCSKIFSVGRNLASWDGSSWPLRPDLDIPYFLMTWKRSCNWQYICTQTREFSSPWCLGSYFYTEHRWDMFLKKEVSLAVPRTMNWRSELIISLSKM